MSIEQHTNVAEAGAATVNTPVNSTPSSQKAHKKKKQQQEKGTTEPTLEEKKKKRNNNRRWNNKKKPQAETPATDGNESRAQNNEENKKPKNPSNKDRRDNRSKNGELKPALFKNRAQSKLTIDGESTDKNSSSSQPNRRKNKQRQRTMAEPLPTGDHDIATKLIYELKNSTYECMICMDTVRPANQIWSCDCCWAVFHLGCIKMWANKSLQDTSSNKMITQWRCPGCQNSRTAIPKDYLCFCGKQRNPEPSKYYTPHSCNQLCKKHKSCPHECVLSCHPGPCPPCNSLGPVKTCYCGKTTQQKRCVNTDYSTQGFSCDIICDELLGCGKHRCEEKCHKGICPPCTVEETQSCYCGKSQRDTRCGSGKQVQLGDHVGHYNCEHKCEKMYKCQQHSCQKGCHPCLADAQSCPFDPDTVTTCPCGSNPISELTSKKRTACTDPIPTCESTCNKKLACGHACQMKCHVGECPPCQILVQVSCRCQATTFERTCSAVCEAAGGSPPLCDKVCKTNRNCGRHQCGVVCCPAAKVNGKNKKGTDAVHDCSFTCGKLLSCGTHTCQAKCHKGNCLPCLEATFDEVSCHCGRTVLEPPVRCGTTLPVCPHPCIRPNPCGHIRFLNHNCHPDNEPCPPCPALVTRHCLCGKTELKNVPCYRESPRCGRPCEKLLPCGKHHCLKTCHNGPCLVSNESCNQTCGNERSCKHPCKEKCHHGTPCPETTPCMFRVKASCKCGQNTMEIPCNASSKSSGSKTLLECNDFCAKVHRNRRLALALDIKRDDFGTPSLSLDDLGYYDDSLREFFNENASWCRHMEATLIEFVKDPFKKTSHLRPMKSEYRRFIHRYAVHFNIATEAIDAEPKRSVILRKTLGACRIPAVLLSKAARNPNLNRPPPVLEAAINGEIRAPKNPVNALYLSDMAFGLTKLELDAELVPLMKLGDDTIPFNSTWVNENDAVVVPIINDTVSIDEKELIVWQLKKTLKAAFASEDVTKQKASRVDCCWVNQKGEITWSEKQLLKSNSTNTTSLESGKSSSPKNSNSFAALSNMDDDGWMRVGDDNPYRAVKDAWKEEIQKSTTPRIADSDASSCSVLEEISDISSTEKPEVVNVNESKSSESDDWELLTEENNL
ncbi:hypothetical protein RMATCC62417_15868 [Rhizopus microsporus]|nr:hypothetical protein RMATCC62417_15868 [Rhizopus microsporus]